MGAITFKCPNCGGELRFDPETQNYKCPYCGSTFTQDEIDRMHPQKEADGAYGFSRDEEAKQEQQSSGDAVLYSCPSCGAQIVTDETTAATECYYCHNPVILEGRLQGKWQPDLVIPFSVSREEAKKKISHFIQKKRFVPKRFYNEEQMDKLTGVYYPYWIYEAQLEGSMQAKATKVRVMRMGDDEITETDVFAVRRGGSMRFDSLTREALQSDHRELVENVQPYRLNEAVPFKTSLLSGFQAEKRDIEKENFQQEVDREMEDYAGHLLRDAVSGYTTVNVQHTDLHKESERWRYCLLPVWVMTYRSAGGRIYYYALNGQTGNAAGKLPVDIGKLAACSLLLGAAAAILVLTAAMLL